MWRRTFGASWRGSVTNLSIQLWTLVFTIAACATMSFAATGVYEGDCDSTNTFKDPNTGETFCYRIARMSAEHFEIYNTSVDWYIARPLCKKDTKLRFGGVQRRTTIVTINSALENEFVRNFVLAEFSKLNETERELAIPKVLLGELSAPSWLDKSDKSYLAHRLGNTTTSKKCLYMSTVTRRWSVELCMKKSNYEKPNNKFSVIVCKARFKTSASGSAVAPSGNFRYDCVHTSEFTDGDVMPNETFCYNVTILPISKEPNYYEHLKRVCEERSFAHHGEVKKGFLLTLNFEEEDRFVHEVLVKPFLARPGGLPGKTSGGLLLGAEGEGWADGSNSALLHKQFRGSNVSSTSCRYLWIVPDLKWVVYKCPPAAPFGLNVCKARFKIPRTTSTTTTTPTTTTTSTRTTTSTTTTTTALRTSATTTIRAFTTEEVTEDDADFDEETDEDTDYYYVEPVVRPRCPSSDGLQTRAVLGLVSGILALHAI